MITVIDYGAGNLRSVVNAITRLGYKPEISNDPADVASADVVVLPGVGAAGDTVTALEKLGMVEPIRECISAGRPFLAICIGLQVLLSGTEEGGWKKCLNIVPGTVKKLPPGLKIPHMGWNQVKQKQNHPVFKGIPDETNFYFVHSYYAAPEDEALVAGTTDYGITFCSAIARDNMVATQFHPERSGDIGLQFYQNFFEMAGVTS